MSDTFVATAWVNGSHNNPRASYGLKVRAPDRDRYFMKEWRAIRLLLPNGVTADVNVAKGSFWSDCRELISQEIGEWLLASKLAPWPSRRPPRFVLWVRGPGEFVVTSACASKDFHEDAAALRR